jgi:hypothetical protein
MTLLDFLQRKRLEHLHPLLLVAVGCHPSGASRLSPPVSSSPPPVIRPAQLAYGSRATTMGSSSLNDQANGALAKEARSSGQGRARLETPPKVAEPESCLNISRIDIDMLSDFARLKIEAEVTPNCRPHTQFNAEATTRVALWSGGGAFIGLSAMSGKKWLQGAWLDGTVADRRFANGQAGPTESQGHFLQLGSMNEPGVLLVRPLSEPIRISYITLLTTVYDQGVHRLHLPPPQQAESPKVELHFPRGGTLVSSEAGLYAWRSPATGVEAELLRLTGSGGTNALAWRVRAASSLAPPPKGAHLVVIIDTSLSVSSSQLEVAIAGARVWVEGHHDSRVTILSFNRQVHQHGDDFVTQTEARQILANLPRARGNGSFVELALSRASALLHSQVGPKRVLLVTDGEYRSKLVASQLLGSLSPQDAPLFLGLHETNRGRRPNTLLKLVQRSGGFAGPASSSTSDWVELIEPSQVTSLRLFPRAYDCAGPLEGDLPAGVALRAQEQADETLLYVTQAREHAGRVSFELWGHEQSRMVPVDEELSRLQAANSVANAWGLAEQRALARLGHVASAFGSHFLALPGKVSRLGVTPPARTFEELTRGATGYCVPNGNGGVSFASGNAPALSATDGQRLLAVDWAKVAIACGVGTTRIQLELDGPEIADVVTVQAPEATQSQRGCLTEGAWAMSLPTTPPALPPGRYWISYP